MSSHFTDSLLVDSYHPQFDCEDADTVLRSAEGTLYRIPSFVLRTTSGFFNSMLSLPSPKVNEGAEVTAERKLHSTPIPIPQSNKVLERILRMMSGLEIPRWESFDEVEELLTLAESWDAPGPLSVIRSGITAPMFLADPLRLYRVTTHFGWEEESKLASNRTLSLNLYDDEYQDVLNRLSSRHLLALLRLHKGRRDAMKKFLDDPDLFNAGNGTTACRQCGSALNNYPWRELKARIFWELDRRPLGDTVSGLEMEEWPETVACWRAGCKRTGCQNVVMYDKVETLAKLRGCVEKLPMTV